jgi:hypothetical protein
MIEYFLKVFREGITILQRRFPKVLCKALVRFYKALRQPLRKEDPKDPNPLGYEQGPGEPPPHARAQSRSERLALEGFAQEQIFNLFRRSTTGTVRL